VERLLAYMRQVGELTRSPSRGHNVDLRSVDTSGNEGQQLRIEDEENIVESGEDEERAEDRNTKLGEAKAWEPADQPVRAPRRRRMSQARDRKGGSERGERWRGHRE
jgi:pyruvate/2-oxoglutarate dehydrogenase complex dihydrolipoamide acyltransferase (E2) component